MPETAAGGPIPTGGKVHGSEPSVQLDQLDSTPGERGGGGLAWGATCEIGSGKARAAALDRAPSRGHPMARLLTHTFAPCTLQRRPAECPTHAPHRTSLPLIFLGSLCSRAPAPLFVTCPFPQPYPRFSYTFIPFLQFALSNSHLLSPQAL